MIMKTEDMLKYIMRLIDAKDISLEQASKIAGIGYVTMYRWYNKISVPNRNLLEMAYKNFKEKEEEVEE